MGIYLIYTIKWPSYKGQILLLILMQYTILITPAEKSGPLFSFKTKIGVTKRRGVHDVATFLESIIFV